MTELAVRQDSLPALQDDPTGGRLVAWAQAAQAAHSLARSLVRTNFVPDTMKAARLEDGTPDPGNATAVIIMGDELGLSPLASLRSIYIFKGTPSMYARTMRALALSHGHQMWNEKSTDDEVVVCGRRRGSEHVERSVWTIARAKKAGYTSNAKYASNPQEMLQAKADAEIARKIAADVLAGIPSMEELELEPSVDAAPTTEPPKATRMSRPKPTAPEPVEPDLPPPPVEDEPALIDVTTEDLDTLTAAQSRNLHRLLGKVGAGEREAGLSKLAELLGFAVTSSKELTVSEASTAIDLLKQEVGEDA